MKRRQFISSLGAFAALGTNSISPAFCNALTKEKKIILVSGWQDVNIGDITHTPGLLHILETYLPKTQVTLWKRSMGKEVKEMLNRNFPNVKIIYGDVDDALNVNNPEVFEAFKENDFMLHGSGPSIVGQVNLEAWVKATGKPFGVFGTTIQNINPKLKTLLEKASFIFTRETASIKVLKENNITGDHIGFAPDATFFFNSKDDTKAKTFLQQNSLEGGKFICVIPRLRYTPYYKWAPAAGWTEQRINEVNAVNEKNKEPDHAKMREAMIAWVRETKNKILVCPEMTYQVEIMDELLINPLPDDVKPFVIKRGYWLPDEAASVYAKSFSVLSFECHSPIIASANNTPFFYLRQPEDTIKGQMYYDLGLSDWVFEIEQSTGKQVADRLIERWKNPYAAKQKLATAMNEVSDLYKKATRKVSKTVQL